MYILQLKTAISRATSRNDMATVRDALEVSAEMFKKDTNNVSDFVQRHLRSITIWEELRYEFTFPLFFTCYEKSTASIFMLHKLHVKFLSCNRLTFKSVFPYSILSAVLHFKL